MMLFTVYYTSPDEIGTQPYGSFSTRKKAEAAVELLSSKYPTMEVWFIAESHNC